jgi:hypothetical protein
MPWRLRSVRSSFSSTKCELFLTFNQFTSIYSKKPTRDGDTRRVLELCNQKFTYSQRMNGEPEAEMYAGVSNVCFAFNWISFGWKTAELCYCWTNNLLNG